jgi:LAO/AO transport system kinase
MSTTTIDWNALYEGLVCGDVFSISRLISLVENRIKGTQELMRRLHPNPASKVLGITGPPGAGKSTLTDALIHGMVADGKRVGVLCVDPSSPFHLGALLGDRIRMSSWYNHPQVYIRSLASRGSLGGLHPQILDLMELMKCGGFDWIIIETVGVGQSEIEIAGLADLTMVVLVPESGDEIQTMKAGLMEIADLFVVNKSDRPDAERFINNLKAMLAPVFQHKPQTPIFKTIASSQEGINEVYDYLKGVQMDNKNDRSKWLIAEKAFQLIREKRIQGITVQALYDIICEKGIQRVYELLDFPEFREN